VKPPISFWRYTLSQELIALALALGVLTSSSSIILRQLNQRFIKLHRADADRVQVHLQEHLNEAIEQFQFFSTLESQSRNQVASRLITSFSDIYELDHNFRVVHIYKQQQGSRVFRGFSFAGSPLADHLQQQKFPEGGPARFKGKPSAIIRAAEDEIASIYIAIPDGSPETFLVGRLNLNYIQNFLRRFTLISGNPLLLVNNDGFVMLSSNRDLPIASIDLRSARAPGSLQPIQIGSKRWLPVVGDSGEMGSPFVTLVPTQPLEHHRRLMVGATLVVSLLLIAIFILKTRRLQTNLFNPVRAFADQLREVESGNQSGSLAASDQHRELASASERFLEMRLIQERFAAMVAAIQQRESELRQALRASLAAAAVGHEIKQPLSTIRLLCQQANRSTPWTDLRPVLAQLDSESSRVARTVESMRMLLSNVQSKQEPLDLAAVANNAVTFTHHQRRILGVGFRAEGLNGLPMDDATLTVMGDPVQLQIAIGNLLRNGAEAAATMPAGHRLMRLRLLRQPPSPAHPHGVAGLEVADSGPGLPELEQINQGVSVGRELGRQPLITTKAGGSGLGLFVVRCTLEQHGGWLQAGRCSDLGGAAVSLWLPLRPADHET
jgi:signal transduction histidine kinase